jgi:hypothetical protein
MSKIGGAIFPEPVSAGLLLILLFAPWTLSAQQADIPSGSEEQENVPPVSEEHGNVEPSATPAEGRIVDKRPSFYWLRQKLHPASWIASAVSPLLRGIETISFKGKGTDGTPAESGIKFGVRGHGQGSGIGPEVKPFHTNLFNKGIKVELPLSVTYKMYELARVNVDFPLSNRAGLQATGRYASRPSENFFGMGNDSLQSDLARYRGVVREAGAGLSTRIGEAWTFRVGASYRSVGITRPRHFLSASDAFRAENIPGLSVEPASSFIVTTAALQRDTREDPNLPAKGALWLVETALNEGQTGGDFSYWQYRGELRQFFSLSGDNRKVIGLRATIETNQAKGGSDIPFFGLTFIGSYSTLRGFDNRRFIDRSAMTASVDYRYRIWRRFDWGFFVDTGQVAPEVRNFAWDRLHTGCGMRFVMRARENRAFIIDVARSREEPFKLYVDFSPLF